MLNPATGSFPIIQNTHVAYVSTYLSTGEVRMLEPDGFTTNNLFPAGKVIKPRCFPIETPDKEKALARMSVKRIKVNNNVIQEGQ